MFHYTVCRLAIIRANRLYYEMKNGYYEKKRALLSLIITGNWFRFHSPGGLAHNNCKLISFSFARWRTLWDFDILTNHVVEIQYLHFKRTAKRKYADASFCFEKCKYRFCCIIIVNVNYIITVVITFVEPHLYITASHMVSIGFALQGSPR